MLRVALPVGLVVAGILAIPATASTPVPLQQRLDAAKSTEGRLRGAVGQAVGMSANGARDTQNRFYYDGIEGMNFDGGTRAFDPSLEAVQEVKVLVNSNSAEYGGAAGATAARRTGRHGAGRRTAGSARWGRPGTGRTAPRLG